MQRRIYLASAMTVVAALTLAGCSSGDEAGTSSGDWTIPSTDPTATIQVLGHQKAEEGITTVIEAFMAEHPTITVKYESVPFNDLNSVIDARIANRDGNPDVYWADQPRIAALAAKGYAEKLSGPFADAVSTLDSAPVESSSYDGDLWAVPIANSTQLMFYNKDLLDAAGVAYPSASPDDRMTWEALVTEAGKTVDSGAGVGLLFGQPDRYYQLEPLPVSLGGSVGATGDGNLTPDLTGDAWEQALTWYASIYAEGVATKDINAEQSDDAFLAGNVAYFVQGPWMLPKLTDSDLNWGVAPHPYFEGGEAITPTGSWSLAMSPFSDEKEAAAIFMKWMSIDNGGGYAINMPAPELPASPEGKASYFERSIFDSEQGKDAVTIIDFETQNTAVPRVGTVGYVEFEEIVGRAFSDVKNGAAPSTALKTATSELEAAWAKYR